MELATAQLERVFLEKPSFDPGTSKRLFRIVPRRKTKSPERGFGDFVVLDSLRIRNGSLRLTIPWHVDDTLHGARRDSAIT